jgi:hypothetical protein
MTGLEPLGLAVLAKAVDFLFDEAKKIFNERRETRSSRGDYSNRAEATTETNKTTKKEEILTLHPNLLLLQDSSGEIEHCLAQIQQYRQNKRILERQVALYGGFIYAHLQLQNQLIQVDDELENWCAKLKGIVEEVYNYKLTIPGLETK